MTFYCHFCDKRCRQTFPELKEWWCEHCRVTFQEGNGSFGLDGIKFSLANPDYSHYYLTINFASSLTILSWHRPPRHLNEDPQAYDELPKEKVVLRIWQAIQGVKPNNLKDKIQTLLTFS